MSSHHERAKRIVLTSDIVFVGMTRPAMALGVPYIAVLGNALVTVELFLVTRNLLWLLAAVPIHGLTYLLCVSEPRFFDLLHVWAIARRRGGFGSTQRWGAISYGPLPARRRGRPEFNAVPESTEAPC